MRSRVNIYNYNKRVENKIKSRESMIKEKFGNANGNDLTEEINKAIAMDFVLDSEFQKKYIEFNKDTTILISNTVKDKANKYLPVNGINETYKEIKPFFNLVNDIKQYTKNKQSGTDLILNAIEIDNINYSRINTKANMSIQSLNSAYENFKNAKEFFVFDTETLSGMGKTGYNELDSLQEIAFRKFKKINGKVVEKEADRIETLIGITEEQYKEYYDVLVKNFDKDGYKGVQKYEVIANRFAKLGHRDTKIDPAGKGLFVTSLFASDDSKDLMDVKNIERGLKKAREIGKIQDKERLANGLMVWEDQLLRSVKTFQDNFVVGYNSTNFDFEKINQSVAKIWSNLNESQKAEYRKILGLGDNIVPTITTGKNNYMDFRDVVRTAAEFIGKTGIYGNDDEKLKSIKDIGKTLLQQESLGEAFVKSSMTTAAHTAGADVTTLANLIANKEENGESLLDRLMKVINEKKSPIETTVDKNAILMATQGEFFNDFTRKGALNFTTDRTTGAIRTFNGFSLEANGDIRDLKQFGKATGIKKDVAYNIEHMGEIELSEEWIKKISKVHEDYAQGKLWSITLNPMVDKNIAGNNNILEDPTTYFFTSKEAMEGFVSSHFTHIGNVGPNGKLEELKDAAAREAVRRDYSTVVIKDGQIIRDEMEKNLSSEKFLGKIINRATEQSMNDSAARMIRENEYTKAVKFRNVQDYLIKNGASTVEEQKRLLSLTTAESIASGKVQKIKHDVLSILGDYDYSSGKTVTYPNTLNNVINSYSYMASRRNVIDAAVGAVKGYGEISSNEKQFIYDNIIRNLREDAADLFASNDKEKELLFNGSSELRLYEKDLNYFEFDMPENYFKHNNPKSTPKDIDNVLRVDLRAEKEYSLVNELIRRRRGEDSRLKTPNAREAYGMQELRNFAKEVNKTEEYKGIFDEILYGKPYTELRGLANIKKYEKNSIKEEMYSQFDTIIKDHINSNEDVLNSLNVIKGLKEKKQNIKNGIAEYKANKGAYTEKLKELNQRFKATIVSEDEWASYLDETKDTVKSMQQQIIDEQKGILDLFDKGSLYDDLEQINSELDSEYERLFSFIDSSKKEAKTNFSKELKATMQEKEKEIKAIYDKIGESVENIPIKSDISVDAMSERMIQAIKNYREKNPTAGFSKDRVVQNVLSSDDLLTNLDDKFIQNSIENTKENLSSLKILKATDKNSVNVYAQEIVDNVLMPTVKDSNGNILKNLDEITDFAQREFGFNEETTRLFNYNLKLQREEHIKGISNLLESVSKHGGAITYNPKNSQIGMIINNEEYNLWGLPKTRIENGALFNITGSTKVQAGFKLDAFDALNGTKFNTDKIGIRANTVDAYRELKFLDYNIERAISRGENPGKAIIRSVGNVAAKARELSSLGNLSTGDIYSWQLFDTNEAILSMPHILDKIKAYDGWQDKEFIDIIEKNKTKILKGNINSEVKEAYGKNKQDIIKILMNIGAGKENKKRSNEEFLISQINNYTKGNKLADGISMVGEYSPVALTEFDSPSRPPISSGNEILYSKKELLKKIEQNDLKGKVTAGAKLVSKRQGTARTFNGVGEIVNGVTFTNASISEKKFKEVINNKFKEILNNKDISKEDKDWYEALQKQMSGLNLTEQGKIVDGKLANAMLSSTETQTIKTLKNFHKDANKATEIMQKRIRNAMPTIEIAKSGEIVFKLGKLDYVKRGDALFATEGFGDVLDTIGVKEDAGFFGFKYNSKGTNISVDEDTISKFLNSNKEEFLNPDGTVNVRKAMALLGNEYEGNFYVKNAFVKGYNKGTIEFAEKGMYEALLSGAGTLDSRIGKLLDETGMDEAKGRILGEDFIDMLEEKYSGLSKEQKEKMGFANGWQQVKEAINKEKYAKTDFVRSISEFDGVMAFSHDNIVKHGNAGIAMKGFINNVTEKIMMDEGLSYEEAAKKTVDLLKKDIVVDQATGETGRVFNGLDISFKDGRIEFGAVKNGLNDVIDKKAVEALSNQLGIYGEDSPFAIKDSKGNVIGYKTTLMTSFNEDFSGTSRTSIEKDKLKQALDDTREELRRLDPNKDSASYKALKDKALDLEHRYNAAKNYDKTMTISSRETDMLDLYEYSNEKMAKLGEKFRNKNLDDDYKKIFKRVLDDNGNVNSAYEGRGIHQGLLDDMFETAYERAVEKKGYFDDAVEAISYNKDPIGRDGLLNKKKFEPVKIEDLVFPTGGDTAYLENDPNRSFGRNILVDTGLSDKNRYIAVPATDYSITGDNVNTDEVQKSLSKLQYAKNRLEDGRKGINGALDGGTTLKDLEARVADAANEVRESIVGSARKTIEGLGSIQLGGYSYEKASMQMYDKANPYHMYNVSKINGKTIGEWADAGVHYDASWHGKQYFKDLGYLDEAVWKDKYGMKSEDEMLKYLSEHGTAGIELRTPTIKEGSVSVSRQFLDPTLLAGQSKSTAPMAFGRNQDHDGDSVIQAELRHKETGMTLVDYEMAKKKAKNGGPAVPESAEKYFEELNAAQTYRASTVNEKIFNEVAQKVYEEDQVKAVDTVNVNKALDSSKVNLNGRYVTPFSQVENDTALRNDYLKKYGEIENALIERLGSEKYTSLEQLDRAKEIDKHIATLSENLQDEYRNAARFVEIYEKDMASVMSKIAGKASIGYINTPLASMRRAAAVEGLSRDERKYIQAAADILEENIISKKHSTDYTISLAQTFRTHLNDMFEGKQSGVDGVNELIRQNYSKEIAQKINIFSDIDFGSMSDDEILENVTSTISNLGKIAQQNSNFKNIINAENMANVLSEDNLSSVLSGISENSTGANKILARAKYNEGFGSSKGVSLDMDGFSSTKRTIASGISELADDAIKTFSGGGGAGLATAALGVAAAIMATGYIGGNPTIAPGTEAQDLDNYNSLQDQDLSIQELPQGTGQGYVININAQSSRGKDHAMQAIQKAMRSSVPTDINIAMSVKDNTKIIDSKYVENLLLGAL